MANHIRTISILNGIKSKLPANSVVYDKACDAVENKVTQSYFSKTIADGKQGFKAPTGTIVNGLVMLLQQTR